MAKRLCIIPCGRAKIWDKHPEAGPTPAKDAYVGTLAKCCQAYAKLFFDDWTILSAKHGFLLPDDEIKANYDLAFDAKDRSQVITTEQLHQQLREKGLDRFDEIVLLAGKKHKKVVEAVFDPSVYSLTYPLQGQKGIGYMVQALQEAVRNKQEIGKK